MVRELEFTLSAEGVDAGVLVDAVAGHYPLAAQAAGARWSGFLRGFIDMVFESGGRYYVLDWKSNHLGGRWDDYAPRHLEADVGAHAYALQFCLYTLALHRLLRTRIAGYHYDRHVGGVYYLYLRGVRPANAAGQPGAPGVYATRPPRALIERLDAIFGGRG
jgi:exodeoxyribonuclease V beta subunit